MERPFEEFGSKVFSEKEMLERLPSPVYKAWKKTLASEGQLDRPTADAIAHAMKRWAMEHGATHFTHWFQPLNGTTAEKHDAFVEPDSEGEPISRFSGKMLIKGEPDASSFPSGGLRATFEARGYTYWDVTSPVFIKDDVLCIPTVFVSYNGEALDRKEPLLKSLDALSTRATKVVNLLGDDSVRYCDISVGLEQEYFLIDRKYYDQRIDLKLTGRTLFGTSAPKGQELNDHYFGAIPSRVKAYMKEVNEELWKLGIYAKTEHNEVAPAQFELAPVFSGGNIAVDQNLIIMDILKRVAEKHGFACLLHEKPFDGINGSGKHNNYSIVTDNGQNLFDPGKKPEENIRFLTFICAFIKAVDTYPVLLRLSASSAGNDHRLGANEAPPAIISIYLGSYIEDVLYRVYKSQECGKKDGARGDFAPVTNISYIPHDNTDRNRTSPVAFTGNKFEFRMLGSSMNASFANTVLSSIIADALQEVIDILSEGTNPEEIRELAYGYCRKVIKEHKRVLFSGDGYSDEWVKEAERRGLPNVKSFIEATRTLKDPAVEKMFTSLGVFTKVELDANRKIMEERYRYIMDIEVRTMLEMTSRNVLPAMEEEYMFYDKAGDQAPSFMKKRKKTLYDLIDETGAEMEDLADEWKKATEITDLYQSGYDIYYKVIPAMDRLRASIDTYESIASTKFYKLPLYEQMLFDR
ncbi:MAG: glutamine synthetase III [Bulleidia sp.]